MARRSAAEDDRLATVDHYRILDTAAEAQFDELAKLASSICDTPFAAINFIDEHREWAKARVGIAFSDIPRTSSLCNVTLNQREPLIVPDTLEDERFRTAQLVVGEPFLRFYAGAPLFAPNGRVLGTICVADREARELTPAQLECLVILGKQVTSLLELRRIAAEQQRTTAELLRVQDYALHRQLPKIDDGAGTADDESSNGFDLHALIEQSVDLFVGAAPAAGLAIASSIRGDVPRIARGDAERIRRILKSLLTVAVRLGDVTLDVELVAQARTYSEVRFSITVGNANLAASAASMAPDPEFTVAERLVESLSGRIGRSNIDAATSVSWFILRLEGPLQARASTNASTRVLLAGKPGAAANAMRRVLEDGGFVLREASSARDALDLARQGDDSGERFGVIIVWAPLPDMSLLEFSRIAAAGDDEFARLPIVLINDASIPHEELGFAAILDTPLETRRLTAVIAAALDRTAAPSDVQPAANAAADARAEVERALRALEADLGSKSVRRLCAIFLDDVVGRRARLAAAFETADVDRIHLEAHGLKSSISNFRATSATRAADALEFEDDLARLREIYVTFADEADALETIVRAYAA